MSYEYLTSQGVIVADTQATLTEVQDEFKKALGPDLNTNPATPQGVLITAEALARNNGIKNNAALSNQINPQVAGGIFLDAIMALTGVQRNAQTPTVVVGVTITGVAGANLPVGTQAQTAAGDIFSLTSAITIPSSGTITANFQSNDYGPIPCAVDALNMIVTAILGWETVNNTVAGVLGTVTQSDQAARAFRNNTLGFNGISLAAAITSALYYVDGVTSLTFQENISNTQQTINGISMLPHSVYACVAGGLDTDVAAAMLENKSSGAAWNGGTTVNVIEPASGQSYTVLFDRPDEVTVYVRVTTPNGSEVPIVQSILDYVAGLIVITNQNGTTQTLPGYVVGADVLPFDMAGAVMSENPGILITNLELSTDGTHFSNSPVAIGVNQIAETLSGNISVVVS